MMKLIMNSRNQTAKSYLTVFFAKVTKKLNQTNSKLIKANNSSKKGSILKSNPS